MSSVKDRLMKAWDENPLAVITVGAIAATAAAKVLSAVNESQNSRSWKKEVNRRDRNSRR
jgi:hypothetical protein